MKNGIVSEKSFMFNDELYSVGDKVVITNFRKECHIGRTGVIRKVFLAHDNMWPTFTILLDTGSKCNHENQKDAFTWNLNRSGLEIKLLSKKYEVDLI